MLYAILKIFLVVILKAILSRCQERISIIDNINKVSLNIGTVTPRVIVKTDDLICPNNVNNLEKAFSIPCDSNSDCKSFGNGLICCDKKCLNGTKLQKKELPQRQSVRLEKVRPSFQLQLNDYRNLSCPPFIQIKSENPRLFSIACTTTANCMFIGSDILCCEKICAKGIADLKEASSSASIVIPLQESTKILICPSNKDSPINIHLLPLFNIPCQKGRDCLFLGKGILCCNNKCTHAVEEQKIDETHSPRFFGLIDTICPKDAIAEALDVQLCQSDFDCGGRICCPDKNAKNYCRTPAHRFDKIPGSKQFEEPIKNLISFMQCAPPPPTLIDIFPKSCRNNFDCFPNLCCQENGKKYCRPSKKSFLAAVVKSLGTSPAAKLFITRFTI